MKPEYENILNDRLSRKLALLLGSQKDWISAYALWCADNDVNWNTEAQDDHHIQLFVKQEKRNGLASTLTLVTHCVMLASIGLLAAALHWPANDPTARHRPLVEVVASEAEMRTVEQRYWDNYFLATQQIYDHQVRPKKLPLPPRPMRLAVR